MLGLPAERSVAKVVRVIDEHARSFIAHAPFFRSVRRADGLVDVSPKIHPVRQGVDERTRLPDRPGGSASLVDEVGDHPASAAPLACATPPGTPASQDHAVGQHFQPVGAQRRAGRGDVDDDVGRAGRRRALGGAEALDDAVTWMPCLREERRVSRRYFVAIRSRRPWRWRKSAATSSRSAMVTRRARHPARPPPRRPAKAQARPISTRASQSATSRAADPRR